MAMSTGEQMEEGTSGAPIVGLAWPDVATTSQMEVAQPEPSSMWVAAIAVGQTEEGTPKASLADVAMG